MSKVASRLLTFFIGVPVVLLLVFFTFMNHLALNIAAIAGSIIAAYEFTNMFKTSEKPIFNSALLIVLSALQPISAYIFSLFSLDINLVTWVLCFEALILMAIECFSQKTFENSAAKIANSIFCIFYTGFLLTFLTRLTVLENSRIFISFFFLLVFLCDSAAWLFGVLWGKSTRGIFAASPNKSLVGFLGGIAADIALGILAYFFFPDIFGSGIWKIIIICLLAAFSSIVGDLIESVLKRSCNVKDSGNIIPGRGGFLDSIDSLILTVPFYYIAVYFLYIA